MHVAWAWALGGAALAPRGTLGVCCCLKLGRLVIVRTRSAGCSYRVLVEFNSPLQPSSRTPPRARRHKLHSRSCHLYRRLYSQPTLYRHHRASTLHLPLNLTSNRTCSPQQPNCPRAHSIATVQSRTASNVRARAPRGRGPMISWIIASLGSRHERVAAFGMQVAHELARRRRHQRSTQHCRRRDRRTNGLRPAHEHVN